MGLTGTSKQRDMIQLRKVTIIYCNIASRVAMWSRRKAGGLTSSSIFSSYMYIFGSVCQRMLENCQGELLGESFIGLIAILSLALGSLLPGTVLLPSPILARKLHHGEKSHLLEVKYLLKSKFSQRAKQASSRKCGIWIEEQVKPNEIKGASSRGTVVTDQQVQKKNTKMLASQSR